MQWIITFAALAFILALALKSRRPLSSLSFDSASGSLGEHLAEAARQAVSKGRCRIRLRRRVPAALERDLSFLLSLPQDQLQPAASQLCSQGRFLQKEAFDALHDQKGIPSLPCTATRQPRVCLFVQEWFCHTAAVFTPEGMEQAVRAWHKELSMTADELDALPFALRAELIKLLAALAQHCALDQRAVQKANKAHQLLQNGKFKRAHRLMREMEKQPVFWEQLLQLSGREESICARLNELGLDEPNAIHEAHAHEAQMSQWVQNALASLHMLQHSPWEQLLESLSPLHASFCADPVYRAMTAQSRADYRRKAGTIARLTKRSEAAVASSVLSMCQDAADESVEAHIGYYLLDGGYPALLHQLQAMTLPNRIRLFVRQHACGLYRLGSWMVFIGVILLAWLMKLSVFLWLPLAAVTLHGVRQLLSKRRLSSVVPRLEIDHLDERCAALVVCPVMLHDASHAIAAVKHLSILQKANPDPHLHFLLLGEFPDGLRSSHGSEAEIIPAASAAVEALCEECGAVFLYFQRERTCEPGAHAGLHAISRWICGKAANDEYAYTSVEPIALHGRYRCIIPLEADVFLPPGSALQMIGAMLHPLHKRRKQGHCTYGSSMLQPRIRSAPHQLQSRLSALLRARNQIPFERDIYAGIGIAAPAAYADSDSLMSPMVFGEWNGCKCLPDVTLYASQPQTLEGELLRLHQSTSDSWALLPLLLGFFSKSQPRKALDLTSRFRLWHSLFISLLPILQLTALFLTAVGGHFWLWLFVLLIAQTGMLRAAFLPCSACTAADAIARTLWRICTGRELPLSWSFAMYRRSAHRPPMRFFSLNMGFAGLFAALTLLPLASAPACWISAAVWALFAFCVPALEQNRMQRRQPTEYMREALMRTAKHTLAFFETAITQADHALPPDNVQIDPNKGIAHHTTPDAIGLYLCALISAQKLGLLSAEEMATRMDECVHTLETLPKWKGLAYERYDTQTLQPAPSLFVSAESCGMLLVSLITCAQGIRSLPAPLPDAFVSLAVRMDALAQGMQVEALYSQSAQLFYTGMHTAEEASSQTFESLLASPSRLLSFAAVMLGRIPMEHWQSLGRPCDHRVLLSPSGGMDEYMLPLLFQPVTKDTLLFHACRKALALQRRSRLGGAFGISSGACCALEADLYYQKRTFGLPALALDTDTEATLLTPYAAFLALSMDLKGAFTNTQRLEMLGLQGQLGFFESADFSRARTDGAAMKIVRSHTAVHQAMILCAICNALCGDYLTSLFSNLPSAQAFRLLLEEPPMPRARRMRRPLHTLEADTLPAPLMMQRQAQPLHFPIDAHILFGDRTLWLIDAQGGGYLKRDGVLLTRFHESCHLPSGMRIYLRDSHSGAYWMAADPHLTSAIRFETAQAVFSHTRFEISCEMRLWVNPLDGSAIHCLTLENQSGAERVMEVCSYLEPAFSAVQTGRLCRSGVYAKNGKNASQQLWHLLAAQKELNMIRIQCDQPSFLGRGRSFHAPRALELPIGAVADTLGEPADACISLRAQFTLRTDETAVFCFVTHLADEAENAASFCERYAEPEAILHTRENALTSNSIATRFLSISPELQALSSRMVGALAYTGQPWQGGDAEGLSLKALHPLGLDVHQPFLLAECDADTTSATVSQLLQMHAYLHTSGFAYDLVFALRVRTRASAARDVVEAAIEQSHSRQWKDQRGGVWVIERADEEEIALLRCAARMVLQADTPLEEQLHVQGVYAHPLYQPKPAAQWKSRLPDAGELLLENGYGGFTHPEANYQITLAPGANTPDAWCNPLCTPAWSMLAGESELLHSNGCIEAFYLRDQTHHLLWSPTRQSLGHGMPVRVTHAPGETIYESSVYGLYIRICCFADPEYPSGLRSIHIRNEDTAVRSLTLMHTCLFPALVRLRAQNGGVCGWDPEDEKYAGLFALEEERCQPAMMSAGMFQGLWGRAPFALTTQEKLHSEEGSAGVLSFPVNVGAGESVDIVCAMVSAESFDEVERRLSLLRKRGASERLHATRAFWEKRLGVFRFDLPNAALSALMSRWLPYQAQTAAMHSVSIPLSLAFTQPDELQQMLIRKAAQPNQGDLFAQLLLPYTAAYCAEITGDSDFLSQKISEEETLLERCIHLSMNVPLGAHQLPSEGGETVWLGMLLCEVLRRLAPLCTADQQPSLRQKRSRLLEALDRYAWDGSWYLYGWDQDGKPLGGGSSKERRLDLVTQCWAVMCGVSRDRCEIAMENVWRMLYARDKGMLRPFLAQEGKAEQYTLHTLWAAAALHQLGQNDRAWTIVNAVLPSVRASTRQLASRYRAEPYALAEKLCSGRGETAWFWGEVGWCWCVLLEQLIGFRKKGNTLRFGPAAPEAWEAVHLTYRFGSATYHLHALRSCIEAAADGQPLANGLLILSDDGKVHEAFFPLR